MMPAMAILAVVLILTLIMCLADLFASCIPGRPAASGGRSAFTSPGGPDGDATQRQRPQQRPIPTDYG